MTLARDGGGSITHGTNQCCRVYADAQRGEIARVLELVWTHGRREVKADVIEWLLHKDTDGARRVESVAENVR